MRLVSFKHIQCWKGKNQKKMETMEKNEENGTKIECDPMFWLCVIQV